MTVKLFSNEDEVTYDDNVDVDTQATKILESNTELEVLTGGVEEAVADAQEASQELEGTIEVMEKSIDRCWRGGCCHRCILVL
jgi:hypothetical protein